MLEMLIYQANIKIYISTEATDYVNNNCNPQEETEIPSKSVSSVLTDHINICKQAIEAPSFQEDSDSDLDSDDCHSLYEYDSNDDADFEFYRPQPPTITENTKRKLIII